MRRARSRSVTLTSSSPRMTVTWPEATSETYATSGSPDVAPGWPDGGAAAGGASAGPAPAAAAVPAAATPVVIRKVLREVDIGPHKGVGCALPAGRAGLVRSSRSGGWGTDVTQVTP